MQKYGIGLKCPNMVQVRKIIALPGATRWLINIYQNMVILIHIQFVFITDLILKTKPPGEQSQFELFHNMESYIKSQMHTLEMTLKLTFKSQLFDL